jgi:hypothetical protein
MKQDVAYSDMLILAQFHTDFLTEHFKWLQEEDEIAKKPGFRCRQILVRYYLMRKDLEKLKTRIDRNTFGDYAMNLQNLSVEKRQKQKRKSEAFLDEAITSLDNHYLRWCNELLSAALGGEAPLAKVVARILLKHHLPATPSSQIDAEFFSKDHNRHLDLLDFATFVRKNYTREVEIDVTTKRLAQVIATGRFDIWTNDEQILTQNDFEAAKLRDHFCNCYLPLASNSQFVEAGVKEAKIVSTTGRNEELRSVYAICRSFLFGKLIQTKNTPARVFQILTVVIDQNAIHENESTKPERTERRKIVTSALLENHFKKERLDKKQKKISNKGCEDKADNVTQKIEGVEDTAFIDGKTQFGKIRMNEHTNDLNAELSFRGLQDVLLVRWKDKIRALKNHEQQRDPAGDNKFFFPQSEALFIISKL